MNNNRGNNRRRGRGNNRQSGGGQQLNRIDSRARGNAPQLLEKYRKLAHDAHLNGDRVTEEYYLQFADHYFRVLADARQRQDEQRARRDERWQDGGDSYREENEDAGEYGAEAEHQPYGEAPARREREERPRREDRPARVEPVSSGPASNVEEASAAEDDAAGQEQPPGDFAPVDNPFTRESRARGLKPRREREDRRPRRAAPAAESEPEGLDPASLPPSISAVREEESAAAPEAAPAEEAKPRRRTRRPKAASGDAGESLEAVG